jgi:hypothetical protein
MNIIAIIAQDRIVKLELNVFMLDWVGSKNLAFCIRIFGFGLFPRG